MPENYHFIDTTYQLQSENTEKPTVMQRKAWLKQLKHAIVKHQFEIAEALFKDLGKSETEARITEVMPLVLEINLFLKHIDRWLKPKKVRNNMFFLGAKGYLQLEPWGRALIISPWNYPFLLPMLHLISSVAAGNRTMIKPSEFTPNASKILTTIINEVFPAKWVQVVEGEVEATTHLLSKEFDHIHFTGSPTVGKIVMGAASKHLTHCTLELGGKSPFIIDNKIDMRFAVKKLIVGKFINLGQTCIAPDYVLVPQNRKQEFIDVMNALLDEAFADEKQAAKHLAKIINEKQYNRLKVLIESAKSENAEIYIGGKCIDSEKFIAPTVIGNLSAKHDLLHEEIFGPILPLVTYTTIADAVAFINARPKPLSMYLMTNQLEWKKYFNEKTSAGALVINDVLVHIMHPNLPFGGANNSGLGYSTGKFGLKDFSHMKPVLQTSKLLSPTNFMKLPFTDSSKKLLDFYLK